MKKHQASSAKPADRRRSMVGESEGGGTEARAAAVDPRPAAAFILGERTASMWERMHHVWNLSPFVNLDASISTTIVRLRQAIQDLAGEMPGYVPAEATDVLDEFKTLERAMRQKLRRTQNVSGLFAPETPPGGNLCVRLKQLADLALSQGHPLRPIYEFGVALGYYHLDLTKSGLSGHGSAGFEDLPDVRDLAASALALPIALVDLSERLATFVRLAPVLANSGQAEFLGECCATWMDCDVIEGGSNPRMIVRRMLSALAEDVERALTLVELEPIKVPGQEAVAVADSTIPSGKPERAAEQRADESMKPVWIGEREGHWVGELSYGGRLVRKVRPPSIAKNVVTVLDAFQEGGDWPLTLTDPVPGAKENQRERLHETIRSLNHGLLGGTIRFKADGTGEAICWEPV